MSYKIVVTYKEPFYTTTLYKRKLLFFWEYKTHFYSYLPYHATGIAWQKKLNIPDSKYIFNF